MCFRLEGERRTHNVHSAELAPHLDTHAQDNALENARLDELAVVRNLLFTLKANGVLNFFVLCEDHGVVRIPLSVDIGKNLKGFIPAVFGREPTGRLREPEQTDEEDKGWNHLDSPRDAEGSSGLVRIVGATTVEGSAVLNEVLD